MSDEVKELLQKTEAISRVEFRKRTNSRGKSSRYRKYRDLADNLEKDGEARIVKGITENQVSGIRSQVEGLNHDDATEKAEKEFIATRRKISEDSDQDSFDEDGNQLYNLFIARQEPREDPSGGDDTTSEEATEDNSSSADNEDNSSSADNNPAENSDPVEDENSAEDEDKQQNGEMSEAQTDFDKMFGDT